MKTERKAKIARFRLISKGASMRSEEDVLGSYTGCPREGEQPMQDADDL